MPLLVARCEVLYTGRLTARLLKAVRLLMFKAGSSFLARDDAGGFPTLRSACYGVPDADNPDVSQEDWHLTFERSWM
jgi:hypothetical protein